MNEFAVTGVDAHMAESFAQGVFIHGTHKTVAI
jgi:hypothetical protein